MRLWRRAPRECRKRRLQRTADRLRDWQVSGIIESSAVGYLRSVHRFAGKCDILQWDGQAAPVTKLLEYRGVKWEKQYEATCVFLGRLGSKRYRDRKNTLAICGRQSEGKEDGGQTYWSSTQRTGRTG